MLQIGKRHSPKPIIPYFTQRWCLYRLEITKLKEFGKIALSLRD